MAGGAGGSHDQARGGSAIGLARSGLTTVTAQRHPMINEALLTPLYAITSAPPAMQQMCHAFTPWSGS